MAWRTALAVSTLIALVAAPGPVLSEEWIFRSADHGHTRAGPTSILCMPSGNVWAHSLERVTRFDGLSWQEFDATGAAHAVDEQGGLWAFYSFGIGRLAVQIDSRSGLVSPRGPLSGEISSPVVYSASDTAFLAVVRDTVRAFPWSTDPWATRTTFGVVSVPLQSPALPKFYQDTPLRLNDGEIWLQGRDAWYRRRNNSWLATNSPFGFPLYRSRRDGLYWGSRGDSLLRWNGDAPPEAAIVENAFGDLRIGSVRNVFEDASGHLWAQGLDGLAIRNKGGWLTLPAYDGVDPGVSTAGIDSSGHVWTSQQCCGGDRVLVRSDGNYVLPLDAAPPPTFQTSRGVLMSTRNDSLLIRRGGAQQWMPLAGRPLHEAADGSVWLSTAGGLARLSPEGVVQPVAPWPSGVPLVFTVADPSGALWFGLTRFDGSAWSSHPYPQAPFQSAHGTNRGIWFAFPDSGVRRFDLVSRTWNVTVPLPGDSGKDFRYFHVLDVDAQDRAWANTGEGFVWNLQGTEWRHELSSLYEMDVFDDPRGRTYVLGAPAKPDTPPVLVLEGGQWTSVFPYDFIRFEYPHLRTQVFRDSRGEPWMFGSLEYGAPIAAYIDAEGGHYAPFPLPAGDVEPIFLDADDQLWFANHVVRLDRTPPLTNILGAPPRRTAGSQVTLTLVPVLESSAGMQFQTRLDGGAWSGWNTQMAPSFLLQDGRHCIESRGRDRWGNIEPTPQQACFEIDTSPPQGSLSGNSAVVSGGDTLVVFGTARDDHFVSYRVRITPIVCGVADTSRSRSEGPFSTEAVQDTLAVFTGTDTWEDGRYLLELVIRDDLGLQGTTQSEITLDRALPAASVTSPSFRTRALGGEVFAEGGGAVLTIPPSALQNDASIEVELVGPASLPATPPAGSRIHGDAIVLTWDPPLLDKGAILSVRTGSTCHLVGPDVLPDGLVPVAYRLKDDGAWERLGGTVRPGTTWLDVLIDGPGTFALLEEGAGTPPVQATLATDLVLSPRVLRRSGGPGAAMVLSFAMESPGAVTGFVHNRAGRLVRTLADGVSLGGGIQSLRWDGRDDRGDAVLDGMYVVTVRTPARTVTKACIVQND